MIDFALFFFLSDSFLAKAQVIFKSSISFYGYNF